jgi:hypothetical protein
MFNFINLDDKTRSYMLAAIEDAERIGNIYYSTRFNDTGRREWVWLLKQAAAEHNAEWLAEQVQSNELMRELEGRKTPAGGYSVRQIPEGAPGTFAEGQFNRFYMLALSKRAREEGMPELEVYRARDTPAPRPESEGMIGQRIPVRDVEAQLRDTKTSLQSPLLRPNSGISLKLPSRAESGERST